VFSPALRAAAHYLRAVEEVAPQVREDLAARLATHTFPKYFVEWQGIGLFPKKVTHKPLPGQPRKAQRERFEEARPFLKEFRFWTNEYFMWSTPIHHVLYRTLELWNDIDTEIDECQSTIRQAEEYEKETPLSDDDTRYLQAVESRMEFLTRERKGWGWWVDFLTSDITIRQLDTWFQHQTAESDDHRHLLERMDDLRINITWGPPASAPPFHMTLEGLQPAVETWPAFEQRVRDGCEKAIKHYRSAYYERLKTGTLNPPQKDSEHVKWGKPHPLETAPTKYGDEHFRWLALRQVRGLRPHEIASRKGSHRSMSAVNEAIESTARLLQLELRPVRPGPPSVLGD
jgi:hypothetical protein